MIVKHADFKLTFFHDLDQTKCTFKIVSIFIRRIQQRHTQHIYIRLLQKNIISWFIDQLLKLQQMQYLSKVSLMCDVGWSNWLVFRMQKEVSETEQKMFQSFVLSTILSKCKLQLCIIASCTHKFLKRIILLSE